MNLPAHYFAADLHLGHRNILRLDGRPWQDINEHDVDMAHNMMPEPIDRARAPELWLLGDVGTRAIDVTAFMQSIRPYWRKIHLIRGNHDDRAAWKVRGLFDSANEALYVRVHDSIKIYLSHYAHRVWRNSHHGSYHLHGHSHGALPSWGRSMDVGVMLHDFRPVSLRTIVRELANASATNHH